VLLPAAKGTAVQDTLEPLSNVEHSACGTLALRQPLWVGKPAGTVILTVAAVETLRTVHRAKSAIMGKEAMKARWMPHTSRLVHECAHYACLDPSHHSPTDPPGCHNSCSISPQLLLLLLQLLPRLSHGCLLLLQLLPLKLQLLQPLCSRPGLCLCLIDTALEL
jgi:hypothetical protein